MSFNKAPEGMRPVRGDAHAETDTRTFATGPPASALTTRPPNSTVTVACLTTVLERAPDRRLAAAKCDDHRDAETGHDDACERTAAHMNAPG